VSDNGPTIPGWGRPAGQPGDVDPFAPPPPPPPPAPSEDEGLNGMFGPPQPVAPRSPYAAAADPVAYAALHQNEVEWAQSDEFDRDSGSRTSHRRRRPSRYVLPAVVGALVVLAIGIGIAGWIRGGSTPVPAAAPTLSQVTVPTATHPAAAATSGGTGATAANSATSHPATAPASAAPTVAASKPATPPPVPVTVFAPAVVLNETTIHGLAASVASHLRQHGWTVTGVGNWQGNVPTTTVYYPPGKLTAAQSLARALGVTRVRPAVRGMLPSRLTVVLTSNPFS
jgi:cytoskeletal protein RodZ